MRAFASVRSLLFAASVGAITATLGCDDKKPSPPPSPSARAEEAGIRVSTHVTHDAAMVDAAISDAATSSAAFDCSEVNEGDPKAGKSVGHTSVVFKIELSTGKKYAFKPNAKKVKDRYKGEIAAYRFAEALGIHNVPPACFRVFEASKVAAAVSANDAGASLFADEAIVEGGKTKGALIPWIEGLGFWAIEKEPLRTETRDWLTNGKTIPEDKTELARQLSTMLVLDMITGNWDRMSGGNVGLDKTGATVLFIDNDAAFMESPPKEALAKNKQLVGAVDRFSKGLVAQLRRLDDEKIQAMLGDESPGTPLVSRAVVAAMAARAKDVIAIVDAKITAHGQKETLYFK